MLDSLANVTVIEHLPLAPPPPLPPPLSPPPRPPSPPPPPELIREVKEVPEEGWKQAEIFFEETKQVCKVILVPSCCHDPAEVISKTIKAFEMKVPSMLCTAQSGYGKGSSDNHGNYMDHFEFDEFDLPTSQDVLQGKRPESIAKFLKENQEATPKEAAAMKAWPTSSSVVYPYPSTNKKRHWGDEMESQRRNYRQKLKELMHGVCLLAGEAGAWLVCQGDCSKGASENNGSIFSEGIVAYKHDNPSRASNLTCIGFHFPPENSEKYKEYKLRIPEIEYVNFEKVAEVPKKNERVRQLIYKRTKAEELWALNPRMTHLVLGGQVVKNAVELLEELVPAAHLVVGGSDRQSIEHAIEKSRRGQVIIMINTGMWANALARAVLVKSEAEKKQRKPRKENFKRRDENKPASVTLERVKAWENPGLELPEDIATSRFLMIDALEHSTDYVAEMLSRALTSVKESGMNELGFATSERERLLAAWGLHMKLIYNMSWMRFYSTLLSLLVVITSLGTTIAPILSRSFKYPENVDDEYQGLVINFPKESRNVFAVGYKVLPLVLTFVQSCSALFSLDTKHSILYVASARILGEIYRYRTRTGIYRPKSNNKSLDGLLRDVYNVESSSPKRVETHTGDLSRTIFAEQLNNIRESALSGGLQLDGLDEASEEARKKHILHQLYLRPSGPPRAYCRCFYRYCCRQRVRKDDNTKKPENQDGEHPLTPALIQLGLQRGDPQLDPYDDGTSLLCAEDYKTFRIEPALIDMNDSRPWLYAFFFCQRSCVLVLALASGIFGLYELQLYIPIAIAFMVAAEKAGHVLHLRERLESTCSAISQLEGVILWWNGLSMVDQRRALNKDYLVNVTESALENVAVAYGNAVVKPKERTPRGDEEEADDIGRKKVL